MMSKWLKTSLARACIWAPLSMAVLLSLSACTSELAAIDSEYQDFDDDLTQGTSQAGLWQSKTIEYCFETPPGNRELWERRKQEFIGAINSTWQAVGVLNLLPRNSCASGMLRVRYSTNTPTGGWATVGRGSVIDMDSEFLGNRYAWGANSYHTFVAAHEFGHSLGFRHEQDHPNSTCNESRDSRGTGIALTGYDTRSIMNYCARQVVGLTELDKEGFRRAYAFLGGGSGNSGGGTSSCSNANSQCAAWAAAGECSNNPNYMLVNCCESCNAAGLRVTSRQSGKCMDVSARGTADGTNIQLYSCNGTGAQSFILRDAGGGTYQLVNTNSNKCVDVAARGTADGTNIQLYTCNRTPAQTFQLRDAGSGFASLVNTNSGKCVDVDHSRTADGTNIHLWSCNNGPNQHWRIAR